MTYKPINKKRINIVNKDELKKNTINSILEDDENLTDSQIMSLIAEAAYDTCRAEIEYANDIEYEVVEE